MDIIEGHNGVYGGKWHIFSEEGFFPPEGEEYLHNSWEGNDDFGDYIYIPTLEIKNFPMDKAIEKLNNIFKFRREIFKLEMINCTEANDEFRFRCRGIIEFNIHGCILTFSILRDIVHNSNHENTIINLSSNIFKRYNNDNIYLDDLERFSEKNFHTDIKILDLMNCNFSDKDKNLLRTKLKSYPLLL